MLHFSSISFMSFIIFFFVSTFFDIAYSYYEIGRRDIPTDVLIRLACYYQTSIDYLLGVTDTKDPYPRSKKTDYNKK